MKRTQYAFTVALALISGVLGGFIWSQLAGHTVFAERGPSDERVIRAERFQLVDKNGSLRAELEQNEVSTALTLYEPGNERRVYLGANPTRATLAISTGGNLIGLMGTPEQVEMVTCGKDGEKISLVTREGENQFHVCSSKGGPGLIVKTNRDGPALMLHDEDLRRRAILGVAKLKEQRTGASVIRPLASIVLLNEQGNVLWSAP